MEKKPLTKSFKYIIHIIAVNMAPHVTFSVPPPVFIKMKSHPEIKWGALAREVIVSKIHQLEGTVHASELRRLLDPHMAQQLEQISDQQYKRHLAAIKRKEWKRTHS